MDKTIVTYSSLSLAVVCTGLATWALYKWQDARRRLRKYVEKYDDPKEVQRYMVQHYGCLEDLPHLKSIIPKDSENYHARLAEFVGNACSEYNVLKIRILDVGCGPGGTSFHLSSIFEEVVGSDTSMPMIMAGQQMKQFAEFGSPFSSEGGRYISHLNMRVPDGAVRERVVFWDEDVCALLYNCGKFDCVLVSNALTDMHDPKAFLENIGRYVTVGGLLIISDVYNWDSGPEEHLGGEGDVLTFRTLKKVLDPTWIFKKEANMPYYFPKCARLAELGNAHVTVWKKADDAIED